MSSLRKFLRSIREAVLWLTMVLFMVVVDSSRAPDDQVSARIYVTMVEGYQIACRPMIRTFVTCRYEPSCSEYSKIAVRRFGIRTGLLLSAQRDEVLIIV
jgi:hypothetical protein